MRSWLLDILVDPLSKRALSLADYEKTEQNIATGTLYGPQGRTYQITNGIPRFVLTEDRDQRQTESSFGFKWNQRDSYESAQIRARAQKWLVERYDFESAEAMSHFFGSRHRVLDAGCGSGFSTSLWMTPDWQEKGNAEWVGADISVAIDVALERLGHIAGTSFIQADVLQLPFPEETFDTIFSEGVLHHTPSTERALKSLVPLLSAGGQILFYVYRKKSPIREFTDDYIRQAIAPLSPEKAWEALRPLTKLGQALAELDVEIEVPEDIPYLGIKEGPYNLQRLIYWHIAKLFWNDTMSFEENHHINFDWYHPRYAHRQSEEEVRRWCAEAGLSICHFDVQQSGFTVRAIKK